MVCHSRTAFAVPWHVLGNNMQTCRIEPNRMWWEERLDVCFSTNGMIPPKISRGCPPYPPLFTLSEQSISCQKQRLKPCRRRNENKNSPAWEANTSTPFFHDILNEAMALRRLRHKLPEKTRRALKSGKWTFGTKINVSRVRFTQSSLLFPALPKSHLFLVTFFPRQHLPPTHTHTIPL